MEIIYNNLKKAICFILVWVLLFPCFILDVSAYENIDGAIEYIESNDVLYKIVLAAANMNYFYHE